jgi:hypothetical protein
VTVRCLVQDRHRSIRQDLDQQRVRSLFTIRILEEMVRYLVSTIHIMCEGTSSMGQPVCDACLLVCCATDRAVAAVQRLPKPDKAAQSSTQNLFTLT